MPKKETIPRTKARPAPPVLDHPVPGRTGYARAALDAAVVEMVRVAVPALALVIFTELVEPKLNVGGS